MRGFRQIQPARPVNGDGVEPRGNDPNKRNTVEACHDCRRLKIKVRPINSSVPECRSQMLIGGVRSVTAADPNVGIAPANEGPVAI